MNNVGILGFGEIGQAVSQLYDQPLKIKDLDRDDNLFNLDLVHICIPFTDKFVDIVVDFAYSNVPKNCIVHSTVAPKTIELLNERTKNLFNFSHCPVRGVHPNLLKGLLTFETFWGCDFESPELEDHLRKLNLKINKVSSKTSELSKLLDTTYYGLCIAWHAEVKKMCDELDVDFEKVSTLYNQTYNEGYKALGKENVVRPVLYPTEKIGGHCVIPNTEILQKDFSSLAFDLILKYK
jgi:3-hydroxyisobutyrate dehydrogenase-like beta-hydroxyacid dehydrogenase